MEQKRMDYKYGYEVAKKYYEEHGNLLPSRTYKTPSGESLGRWVLSKREKYNKRILKEEQIKELEDIGMVWKTENHGGGETLQMKLDRLIPLLTEYFNKNGNLLIPYEYEIEGEKLGDFIGRLRSAKRGAGLYKGQLTEENIKILNNILMVWDLKDAQWEEMYLKTKAIYDKYGTIISGNSFITNGDKSLNKWLVHQKENYKNGTLSKERIDKLESICMVWNKLDDYNWCKVYKEAKKYYEVNGNLLVPDKHISNNIKLGYWIQHMRKAYANEENRTITEKQILLLNDIGMVWDVKEEQWDDLYLLTEECYSLFGTINLPVSFEFKGKTLGRWLFNQRQLYRYNNLSKERVDKLESFDIDWNPESVNASMKEKIIFYYIYSFFNDAISNYKPDWMINGKELDIFIPSLDLGIEYDGERWHSDVQKDLDKNKLCKDNGIRLIRVREPGCPELKDTSIDVRLDDLTIESLVGVITHILKKINEVYLLSNAIDVDLDRDYLEIVKLYLNARPDAQWEEMYEVAEQYYKDNGDLLVHQNYVVNNKKLGSWIWLQRQAYLPKTKYLITQERINKLETIGMVWDVYEYQFQKNYKIAKKYYEEN